MAGECTQSSTSSMHNWWPDLHACPLSSSWSSTTNDNSCWQNDHLNNNDSESSGEESIPDISTSLTNASNHPGLSVVESSIGEAVPNSHIWNQVLLSDQSNGDLPSSHEFGEPLLDGFPPKDISSERFDPTTDYAKEKYNNWALPNMGSFNNVDKQFITVHQALLESQREPKFTNFGANCPDIIPYQVGIIDHQIEPGRAVINPNSITKDPFSFLGLRRQTVDTNFDSISSFGHNVNPRVLGNAIPEDKNRYSDGFPCTNSRSFAEVLSPVGRLSRPVLGTKPILQTLDLSGFKNQVFQTSPFQSSRSTSNGTLARQKRTQALLSGGGKKRRSEEKNAESVLKKLKQETSVVSSSKLQLPKAKLAEKITALQQIVSPFGKTDTASVLWEAIGYIRFLQEQIQLLSSPYMKANASKEIWGGLDKKERGDGKLDLRSRGLCVVPVSCTPQIYGDTNTAASDYLTPLYRGCLYR